MSNNPQSRILVVDDSKTQIVFFRYLLEKNGWTVLSAETGEESLQVLSKEKVDLALLDYNLPGIKGDELCRLIKSTPSTHDIPVLLFTTDDKIVNNQKLVESGADDFISKSVDEDILVLRIKALLDKTEAIAQNNIKEKIDFTKYKIMAVDDSPTYLEFLTSHLILEGFIIDKAGGGLEALNRISENRYDCILVDLLMPGIDGIQLCRKISENPKNIANPIVILMLTEHENKEYMTKALDAGADDFVGKSSDMSVLIARIRALLRRKHIQNENKRIFEELKNKEIEIERTRFEKEIAQSKAVLAEKLQETVDRLEIEVLERKRVEAELLRSNSDLEQFAYATSHDLKEPLRVIIGFIELIKEEYFNTVDERGKDFFTRIVNAAVRMNQMIDDLLEYSKVRSSGNAFYEYDSNAVINEACDNLKLFILEKNAIVHHQALPRITGDYSQLVSIFQNLISNGVKYCDKPVPEINITAEDKDRHWLFIVSDNGIGIDKAYFEKIFEIFQRLHSRSHYSGNGIGLAIVKKIIERHNGKIWVESVPGSGSKFYFTIAKQE